MRVSCFAGKFVKNSFLAEHLCVLLHKVDGIDLVFMITPVCFHLKFEAKQSAYWLST